jgi:hypothetical protein
LFGKRWSYEDKSKGSVFKKHLRKETDMSKAQFITLSGWVFILGSLAFMISFMADSFAASLFSSILLAVGMLSLRAGYGEQAGSFGRSILLLGASGPILMYIIVAYLARLYHAGTLTDTQMETRGLWILIFAGPAIPLLSLTLFGLTAVRSKPMSRLNGLPLIAGIWYPVVYFFLSGYSFTHRGEYPLLSDAAIQITFLIQFLVLYALGGVLVVDTSEQMATA